MKKLLIELAVIFDGYHSKAGSKAATVYDYLQKNEHYQTYLSSASLCELESRKKYEVAKNQPQLNALQLKNTVHAFINEILKHLKIAKTPAYISLDLDDIEGSQMIASTQALGGILLTKNPRLLHQYPEITLTIDDVMAEIHQPLLPSIDFAHLNKQWIHRQAEIEQQMDEVLRTSAFIMGRKIQELEADLQQFTGANHAITCSSGTDALLLAMMVIGIQPGDEIITTPFSFIATAETIALMKATPVFVDIDPVSYTLDPGLIEAAISAKTKVIMPVGLYGQPADMNEINVLAKKHGLKVIIDGAQSFGATYHQQHEVHHCDLYTTSFFPAKPLGCYGDGGAVLTQHEPYATQLKMLRVHGQNKRYYHQYIGLGGRLDGLQAAVLLAKLPHYPQEITQRQAVAKKYNQRLNHLEVPQLSTDRTSVWAQYTLRLHDRDKVQNILKFHDIPTAIHYPLPLHLQPCFQYLGYQKGDFPVAELLATEVISLPMNPFLTTSEIDFIVEHLQQSLKL